MESLSRKVINGRRLAGWNTRPGVLPYGHCHNVLSLTLAGEDLATLEVCRYFHVLQDVDEDLALLGFAS